jgi:tetratricopeptide (TPR) repeat protein
MRRPESSSAEQRRKAGGSRAQRRPSPTDVAERGPSAGHDRRPWLSRWPILLLLLATLAAFARIFGANFVLFDDDFQVYANPFLNPPTLESVARLWQHPYQQLYVPLAYTIFAAIARVADAPLHIDSSLGHAVSLNPALFHVVSIALHLANTWLCFRLLLRLTGRSQVAFVCSLVFALHPIQVESVAWISELRGTTSNGFVLLSLTAFVASRQADVRARSLKLLTLVSLSLLCAMLCKPSAAVLPVVTLALDRVVFQTPWRRTLSTAALFAALALPFVLITRSIQSIPPGGQSALWQRPLVAGDALAFYLFKILIPINLGVDYGRTPFRVMAHAWGYAAWLVPATLLLVCYRNRRQHPAAWLGAVLMVTFLLPNLGLVPFAYQAYSTVADRYAYLAMIGAGLIVSDVVTSLKNRTLVVSAGASIFVALATVTVGQTRHWLTSMDFLRHTIDVNGTAGFAYNNLGDIELANGDLSAAMSDYQSSIKIDPNRVKAYINLAEVYVALNRSADAETAIDQALKLPEVTSDDFSNLGIVLMKMNQPARALQALQTAVSMDPNSVTYLFNQANAFAAVGQFERAEATFRRCIALAPTLAGAHTGLGIVLAQTERLPDAINEFRTALRLQPNDPAALDDLRRAEEITRQQGH